jgi:cytochrome P450
MWAVSRHADVSFALKRPDLLSSSINADRAEIPARETLLGSDPPAHTALRKRVESSLHAAPDPRARAAHRGARHRFRDGLRTARPLRRHRRAGRAACRSS